MASERRAVISTPSRDSGTLRLLDSCHSWVLLRYRKGHNIFISSTVEPFISQIMLFSSLTLILSLGALALAQDTSLKTVKKAFDDANVCLMFQF